MREWNFWINELGGKQYKNRKFGGVYLTAPAVQFEKAVRLAAIRTGVKLCLNCRIDIVIYWPDKIGKKGQRIEVKKGRPDVSNVQKSVEDALQKHSIPQKAKDQIIKWSSRAQQELQEMRAGLPDNKVDNLTREQVRRYKMKALQSYIKIAKMALQGACIANDRGNYELHTKMFRVPPDDHRAKRVWVKIREIDINSSEYMI
jgi:Holliday junction resolvase RusA-like endonuclease